MNKPMQILLICVSILIINKTDAQNSNVDSLANLLKLHQTDDTIKVNLINEIAFTFYNIDNTKMRGYAIQACELANKLDFLKGKAESTWQIGISYENTDKSLALDYYQQALEISQKINDKAETAKILGSMGAIYKFKGNNKLANNCFEQALKISYEIKDSSGVAKYLVNISRVYSGEGDYGRALDSLKKSMSIFEKTGDQLGLSKCLNNIGTIYEFQGNYPQALDYYQSSMKIKEEQNDKIGIWAGLINLGSINSSQSDYSKALENMNKALKIAEELNDSSKISNCLLNIGSIYQQTKNPQALEYYQKALKLGNEGNNVSVILNTLVSIGDLFFSQNNYQKAFENYQQALKLAEEIGRKRVISDILNKMGTIYLKQKKYDKALNHTLKSLTIANELNLLKNKKDIYYQLSEIYSATNDYNNAYKNHKLFSQFKDSIYNNDNTRKITELEYTYKYEKEKQAIELEQQKKDAIRESEKKQQKTIIFSLVFGFVLVSLFAVYLYRSYRTKHKTNLILIKQKHDIEELNDEYQTLNEELKQSNEQLHYANNIIQESEEKLKLLIKNSNDIIVLINENGEQSYISDVAQKLTGYSIEELLGNIEDVIYKDDVDIVKQHWNKVLLNKNEADCVQYRHKHKEKGYVWFEAVAQNFLHHPAINSVVANIRDITERKKAEQAIKESEEAKARMFALEIERMNRELELNQKSMAAATLKLIQNSERDAQTIDRLMEIEKETNNEAKKNINALISDYKRASYSSNWEEFEILFEKVHNSFYEKLNNQFSNLTANERKMCAFLKLNMSSKDIAQITFQSEDALKKARLRLRQKLGIDRETNLIMFIQNI